MHQSRWFGVADIIRRAMVRMDDAWKKAGLSARMLLQVHDELIFETAGRRGGAHAAGHPACDGTGGDAGGFLLAVPLRWTRGRRTIGTRRISARYSHG